MIKQLHINSELATIGLYSREERASVFLFAFSQSLLSPVLNVLSLNKLSQS